MKKGIILNIVLSFLSVSYAYEKELELKKTTTYTLNKNLQETITEINNSKAFEEYKKNHTEMKVWLYDGTKEKCIGESNIVFNNPAPAGYLSIDTDETLNPHLCLDVYQMKKHIPIETVDQFVVSWFAFPFDTAQEHKENLWKICSDLLKSGGELIMSAQKYFGYSGHSTMTEAVVCASYGSNLKEGYRVSEDGTYIEIPHSNNMFDNHKNKQLFQYGKLYKHGEENPTTEIFKKASAEALEMFKKYMFENYNLELIEKRKAITVRNHGTYEFVFKKNIKKR